MILDPFITHLPRRDTLRAHPTAIVDPIVLHTHSIPMAIHPQLRILTSGDVLFQSNETHRTYLFTPSLLRLILDLDRDIRKGTFDHLKQPVPAGYEELGMLWVEDEGNQYGLAPLVAGSPHPKAIPETALLPYGVPRLESNSLAEREERELFQQMLRAQAQDAITRKAKAQQAYEARQANRSSRAVKEQWAEGMEAFRKAATSAVDEPPPKKRAREASSERPEGGAPRGDTFVLTPLGSRAPSPVVERRKTIRRRRSRSRRSRRKRRPSTDDSGSDSDTQTSDSDEDAEGEEDPPINEAGQPMDEDVAKTTPVAAASSSSST